MGGSVSVFNLSPLLQSLDLPGKEVAREEGEPLQTFAGHRSEGYALDWSKAAPGQLALERDSEAGQEDLQELPPQLLFIHQGLQDVKEVHWHEKVPGLLIATSHTGFDVFKTISV